MQGPGYVFTDPSLGTSFEALFHDDLMSDVDLLSGDQVIHAHKCILGARSTTFKSMLFGPHKESRQRQIEVCAPSLFLLFSDQPAQWRVF